MRDREEDLPLPGWGVAAGEGRLDQRGALQLRVLAQRHPQVRDQVEVSGCHRRTVSKTVAQAPGRQRCSETRFDAPSIVCRPSVMIFTDSSQNPSVTQQLGPSSA
jgi:hypothetical protein